MLRKMQGRFHQKGEIAQALRLELDLTHPRESKEANVVTAEEVRNEKLEGNENGRSLVETARDPSRNMDHLTLSNLVKKTFFFLNF